MTDKSGTKNRICLWFNNDAQEAAEYYARTFPDTEITGIQRAPADNPSNGKGDVLVVELTVMGIPVVALNGGSTFPQTEAFSFQVITEDQEETDRLWNAIVGHGGQESQCGWCKDKWGVSWQITPRVLIESLADPDREASRRGFEAMMTMRKIDIAAIEAARAGEAV